MSPLAASARDLGELFREPALTVACVLLIVVSVAWMVITRLIVRAMKKAIRRGIRPPRIEIVKPPKDVWSSPPPRRRDTHSM